MSQHALHTTNSADDTDYFVFEESTLADLEKINKEPESYLMFKGEWYHASALISAIKKHTNLGQSYVKSCIGI